MRPGFPSETLSAEALLGKKRVPRPGASQCVLCRTRGLFMPAVMNENTGPSPLPTSIPSSYRGRPASLSEGLHAGFLDKKGTPGRTDRAFSAV